MASLKFASGEPFGVQVSGKESKRLWRLQKQYRYAGNQTCAGDGLCAMSCPMKINTGELTHEIRQAEHPAGSAGYATGNWTANHFSTVKSLLRLVLSLANVAHSVLGTKLMTSLSKVMHNVLHFPLWTPSMPKSFRQRKSTRNLIQDKNQKSDKVVYFPSCINQTMGLDKLSPEKQPLINEMTELLQKAGYGVIFPENMNNLCCGTIWESKGMPDIADRKTAELEAALFQASDEGKYPVLCDQSPCLYRMKQKIQKTKLYEPVEFITSFLLDKLEFIQTDDPVAIHITCSMRKMGLEKQIIELAKRCSTNVFIPEEIGCCGFAGDKGFTHPEMNAYALRKLPLQIEKTGITMGYSNSRTCEIGLTANSKIPYQSIVYLANRCSK